MKTVTIIPARYLLLIILLSGLFTAAVAQNELHSWTAAKVSYPITKDIDISFTPEVRLNLSARERETLFETTLGYDPFRFLGIDVNYRYSVENRDGNKSAGHRFAFDIQPEAEVGRLTGSLRFRYTNFSDLVGENPGYNRYWRYRAELEYDIKNSSLRPFLSAEFFHSIKDREIDKIRYIGGLKYKFNNRHSVEGYLLYQDYPHDTKSRTIIGATYKFKIRTL